MTIVMVNEHAENPLKMLAVHDQQPVQTLRPNGPDEAPRDRVRRRRASRRPHHLNTVAAEDRVELAREFSVAISDEKARRFAGFGETPRTLTGLLRHPLSVGVARAARQVDPPARQLNEEKHVEALGARRSPP